VLTRRPQEYVALGFNDFVAKPILVAGLVAALKRAAEDPGPAALSRTG
jgi:CheY-like chemotaxis protein